MKRIFLTIALLMWSSTAFAQQPQCNTHDKVGELLNGKYKEFVAATGVANSGHLVELYFNEKTGGFTITATTPGKTSCLVLAGEGFMIKSEEERKLEAIERLPKF